MDRKGFDNDLYLKIQSEKIKDKIEAFGDKLYLEFGGKIFEDLHASRVLPGYNPNAKIKVLEMMKRDLEVLIVVNCNDIITNKLRTDTNLTYKDEVEKLIEQFKRLKFTMSGIVFSFYTDTPAVNEFMTALQNRRIKVYKHYTIAGYPQDIKLVVSEEGLGKNEYVKTTKKLVVVTAPGGGSGKMATCLSQLYHDSKRGVNSGYAKFETFPIWNLPLTHPVNIAYEAATVDLKDVNMIDPFHLQHYNVMATNYNRDCESFPLLKTIFEKIYGKSPYNSPTDMGVNMVGFAITDNEITEQAAKDEIIRRYYQANKNFYFGKYKESSVTKCQMLMNQVGVSIEDRKCVLACLDRANKIDTPVLSIELNDGTIVTGRETDILTAPASCLLNALKVICKLDDSLKVISPITMDPIRDFKINILHQDNYKMNIDNVLMILAVQCATSEMSRLLLNKCHELEHAQAHASYILSDSDYKSLRRLGIDATEELTTR